MLYFSLLIGHLVGDYLLQNDWMASNKKKSHVACFVHCTLYTLACLFFSSLAAFAHPDVEHLPMWFWALIFVTHFLIDRWNFVTWYMNTAGQEGFRTGVCAPWSSIAVDNSLHFLTMWVGLLAVYASSP